MVQRGFPVVHDALDNCSQDEDGPACWKKMILYALFFAFQLLKSFLEYIEGSLKDEDEVVDHVPQDPYEFEELGKVNFWQSSV